MKATKQALPLFLTLVTFFVLSVTIYGVIFLLNLFPTKEKIILEIHSHDVIVGLTIYLKTAIDFAIFIGNLMHTNPGMKKRIAIEIGTALGNALGTILVLIIWNFFKEIPLLLAGMVILASLVLLRMAEESFEAFLAEKKLKQFHKTISFVEKQLEFFNKIFHPLLGRLLPETSISGKKSLSFWNLLWFSFTIPFILGLDDFAGYIPLFSVINVFGFSVGVFLGHMILNAFLFVSPEKTTKFVKHPLILVIGGIAFVGIAFWGFYEVTHILTSLH